MAQTNFGPAQPLEDFAENAKKKFNQYVLGPGEAMQSAMQSAFGGKTKEAPPPSPSAQPAAPAAQPAPKQSFMTKALKRTPFGQPQSGVPAAVNAMRNRFGPKRKPPVVPSRGGY